MTQPTKARFRACGVEFTLLWTMDAHGKSALKWASKHFIVQRAMSFPELSQKAAAVLDSCLGASAPVISMRMQPLTWGLFVIPERI
jgi:hypothetical protein